MGTPPIHFVAEGEYLAHCARLSARTEFQPLRSAGTPPICYAAEGEYNRLAGGCALR